jgi:hypothetical protein
MKTSTEIEDLVLNLRDTAAIVAAYGGEAVIRDGLARLLDTAAEQIGALESALADAEACRCDHGAHCADCGGLFALKGTDHTVCPACR